MTPIEKLIKKTEERIEFIRILVEEKAMEGRVKSVEILYGVLAEYQNILSNLEDILPTEAEHTKQVGTGFHKWMKSNNWGFYDDMENGEMYSRETYNHLGILQTEEIKSISSLWDEYILTLQNKKG
jgi:hypothetical protein